MFPAINDLSFLGEGKRVLQVRAGNHFIIFLDFVVTWVKVYSKGPVWNPQPSHPKPDAILVKIKLLPKIMNPELKDAHNDTAIGTTPRDLAAATYSV